MLYEKKDVFVVFTGFFCLTILCLTIYAYTSNYDWQITGAVLTVICIALIAIWALKCRTTQVKHHSKRLKMQQQGLSVQTVSSTIFNPNYVYL